jgi:hypothetical protein
VLVQQVVRPDVDDAELRGKLDAVAHALRPLHKALLDLVQAEYEKRHGAVRGPLHLFKLVIGDPFFAWLQPLSALMAAVDELHDQKDPVTPESARALRATLEDLIGATGQPPSPDSFVSRYLEILQNHPDVVMLHARVRRATDAL